jgi:hypothetical protein
MGALRVQGGGARPSGRLRQRPQQSKDDSFTFPNTLPLPWRVLDTRRAHSDALLLLRYRVPPNRAGRRRINSRAGAPVAAGEQLEGGSFGVYND